MRSTSVCRAIREQSPSGEIGSGKGVPSDRLPSCDTGEGLGETISMSGIEDSDVPEAWRSLIVSAWAPYGRRSSTLATVYAVITGQRGGDHDRFIARKILEDGDPSLLFSAIRRSALGYRSLAELADTVGARSGDNVATIRDRASRHGNRNVREMACTPS